ncbi:MAG: alpha/beta hydrolase [Rhodobacter sp.]|nr:alpha/beta hydrolase [Rhodobacter sp.]
MINLDNAAFRTINQTPLAVQETGQGQPLVLVHGGVSDMRTWNNQVAPFAERFRTIAYSRRYHLPNPAISPDVPDPIQTHVDDLAGLIEACDGSPAHVIGHSWGGLIVLLLAMQRPEILRSAVLIEPPVVSVHVNVPPGIGQMIRLFIRSPGLAIAIAKLGGGALAAAEKAFRAGDDKTAIERFGRGVLGDRRFEALTPERYQQVWDNRGADRAQALYRGFPDLMNASFARVSLPVLLLAGSESPAVFRLLSDDLAKRLPNARTQIISGASHMVQEDAASAFNEAVLKFLETAG